MGSDLNQYGDSFVPTGDGTGVDIASQRQDELDLLCLAFIREQVSEGGDIIAVDLGGGLGSHSIRMAEAGAKVTMFDLADGATVAFRDALLSGRVRPAQLDLVRGDFATLTEADIPANYQVLYSQRAIHYTTYTAARNLLRLLCSKMAHGGRAFLSAAGFDTEYGKTHPDRARPVQERFAQVGPAMQQKHGITQPIVIYRESEFAALLEDVGFSGISVTTSPFGNIKATAQKL